MTAEREEWVFLRKRAEQLFDEGEVRAALRLLGRINARQAELFAQTEAEYEQTENC